MSGESQVLEKTEAEITEDEGARRIAAMIAHLIAADERKTEPEKSIAKIVKTKKAEPEKAEPAKAKAKKIATKRTRFDLEVPQGELMRRLDAHKEWLLSEGRERFNGADMAFTNIDFSGYTLERAFLHRAQFMNCAFGSKSSLRGVRAQKALFSKCDLTDTPADNADFEGAQFIDSEIRKKNFLSSDMKNVLVTKNGETLTWDHDVKKAPRKPYFVSAKKAEANLSGETEPAKPAEITPAEKRFMAALYSAKDSAKDKMLVTPDLYAPGLVSAAPAEGEPQDNFEEAPLSSLMADDAVIYDLGTDEPGEDETDIIDTAAADANPEPAGP